MLYTRESNSNDIQVVAHVTYAGDLRLSLTAEILLDYPMPSFVGIPLQLNITGLRFDGIAILAYIKTKAHLCFLSPEDAEAFIDKPAEEHDPQCDDTARSIPFGGLLEEIRVESEIGEKESGKQVLKNVGKVEKFILEQVRRIFEDEFVYPSFWTFLV
jgi:distribution and morphology protein 12